MTRRRGAAPRPGRSIDLLPELAEALDARTRDLFRRLYRVSRSVGHLAVPRSARGWVEDAFGSVRAVETQTVVQVSNLVTTEAALFNPLRAARPVDVTPGNLRLIIEASRGDPFCRPEEATPEDVFGRLRGRHSITASNIAKYAPFHGLVIFDEHDPLVLSDDRVRDYLEVGHRWALAALSADSEARYYFFAWNSLWSGGASVIHGHAQVSCTRDVAYARVEGLRAAGVGYRQRYGSSYFEDLVRVHRELGLALETEGLAVLAHLTPTRDKEVLILSDGRGDPLGSAAYRVLDCLTGVLGVRSFNLVLYMPPLAEAPEDWSGFPHMVRIVDRGDPMKRTNDVGAMELYGSPVVSTDPFRLIEALREPFGGVSL